MREDLGLSQNALARKAGMNHPTLQKIEAGDRPDPQVSTLVRLAVALGTTVDNLASDFYAEILGDASSVQEYSFEERLTQLEEDCARHQRSLEYIIDSLKVRALLDDLEHEEDEPPRQRAKRAAKKGVSTPRASSA